MKTPFKSKQEEIHFLKENLIQCKKLKLHNLVDVLERRLNKFTNDRYSS